MKRKKTAVLRSGGIGDLLQVIPALKILRGKNPDDEIIFICGESSADALSSCPYIDKLHTFDDKTMYKGSSFEKAKITLGISRNLKSVNTCFVLHKDKRWSLPAMLAGVMDIRNIRSVSGSEIRPEVYSILLTGEISSNYEFFPDEMRTEKPNSPYIAIAAGGARNVKSDDKCRRWYGYLELVNELIDKTNQHIVLLGTHQDSLNVKHNRITDMCGRTTLSDAFRLIKDANIFIGNDSGLLHLACCTDTFKIALFTSTDPQKVIGSQKNTAVLTPELECAPCENDGKFSNSCKYDCIEKISPDEVFRLVFKRLEC